MHTVSRQVSSPDKRQESRAFLPIEIMPNHVELSRVGSKMVAAHRESEPTRSSAVVSLEMASKPTAKQHQAVRSPAHQHDHSGRPGQLRSLEYGS